MPNDAKLGLAVGMALVIAVAVVFFRKDLVNNRPTAEQPAANAAGPGSGPVPQVPPPPRLPPPPPVAPAAPPTMPARGMYRPIKARPVARSEWRHTIQAGETLPGLARQYYGDAERSIEIYQANRHVLSSPDHLPSGAVLVIPELE
jgi:nucleoid-associated protein YgaU